MTNEYVKRLLVAAVLSVALVIGGRRLHPSPEEVSTAAFQSPVAAGVGLSSLSQASVVGRPVAVTRTSLRANARGRRPTVMAPATHTGQGLYDNRVGEATKARGAPLLQGQTWALAAVVGVLGAAAGMALRGRQSRAPMPLHQRLLSGRTALYSTGSEYPEGAPPGTAATEEAKAVILAARQADNDIANARQRGVTVQHRDVYYSDRDTQLHGYVSWPEPAQPAIPHVTPLLPLVLLLHTGVGPHEELIYWKLEALASLGYHLPALR